MTAAALPDGEEPRPTLPVAHGHGRAPGRGRTCPVCGAMTRSQARDRRDVLREVIDDRLRQRGACLREGSRIVGGRRSAGLWLLLEITVDRDLERALRPLPGGELDVRGGEQIAGLDQRVEVDALKNAGRYVAPPDGRSRSSVRSTDRDDVIKPPVAQ